MDDFYDTDIGVQTSDILVLPSAFLGTLWTELQKPQHKGQWTDKCGTYTQYIKKMGFTIADGK